MDYSKYDMCKMVWESPEVEGFLEEYGTREELTAYAESLGLKEGSYNIYVECECKGVLFK